MESSENYIYRCSDHEKKVLSGLNKLRTHRQLFDVNLVCDGVSIPAHRIVLATSTIYFYSMFTIQLSESQSDCVDIKGVNVRELQQLIEFAYNGEIEINQSNVEALLRASDLLQIWDVKRECSKFIESRMRINNCLSVRDLGSTFNCSNLHRAAQQMIENNFAEVVQNDSSWLTISADEIREFLCNDELNAHEDTVFDSLERWVSHDMKHRTDAARFLCSFVRYNLMSLSKVRSLCQSADFMEKNEWCRDFLFGALAFDLAPSNEKRNYRKGSVREILMVIGGNENDMEVRSVYSVHARVLMGFKDGVTQADNPVLPSEGNTNSATPSGPNSVISNSHADLPNAVKNVGVAVVNNKVYVIGGVRQCRCIDSVLIYDQKVDKWCDGPSMPHKLVYMGVTVLDQVIYLSGGWADYYYVSECHKLDTTNQEWKTCQSMKRARSGHGGAVLNRRIYAVGGNGGGSSVEVYDPNANIWTEVASMKFDCNGVSVCADNDRLYAVGRGSTVQVYTPETNFWEQIADLNIARHFSYLFAFEGHLYVLGGKDSHAQDSIERYDPSNNTWKALPSRLPSKRAYSGFAIFHRAT